MLFSLSFSDSQKKKAGHSAAIEAAAAVTVATAQREALSAVTDSQVKVSEKMGKKEMSVFF